MGQLAGLLVVARHLHGRMRLAQRGAASRRHAGLGHAPQALQARHSAVAGPDARRAEHHDRVAHAFPPQAHQRVEVLPEDADGTRCDALHELWIAMGHKGRVGVANRSHGISGQSLCAAPFYLAEGAASHAPSPSISFRQTNARGKTCVESSTLDAMKRRKKTIGALLAALLAAWLAASARAQAPPGPLPPKPGVPAQQPKVKPEIRVKVDLVNAPVTVTDSSGELVLDLGQGDFRIFDNGVEQRIEHFDLGGDPLSVVAVLETSSRIEALLPAVRKTGIVFTQTVLGPTGEAAVLGYNDTVDQLLPFSSDADKIEKTVVTLRMGTSGARLYDALSEAVGLLRSRPASRRRVIVALSEAADTGSESQLGQVLREAQLSNITIYTVGLSTTAAELRAPPKQAGPPQISPPGTFPLPPMPGTPQTPTSEQQRYGNIDLMALAV